MGDEQTPTVLPTAKNIVALATGFRHVIRGSEGMSTSWTAAQLGPLNQLVRDDDGVWRPDGLTAARLVLRRVVEAYRTAPPPARSRQDIAHTAKVIARRWGIDGFPSDAVDGNPFIDRGDLSAPAKEAAAAPLLEYSDRSRWQAAVAGHPNAIAAAAEPLDLDWATVDAEWSARKATAHPRWSFENRRSLSWPPEPDLPGSEGDWLLSRLRDALNNDPRVVGPGEGDKARKAQLLMVLRRLAVDRHAAYLGARVDTQRHFFHLRHSMARVWFTNDLLDMGGAEEFGVTIEDSSDERQQILRSQASIARMEFYSVIHEWNQKTVDAVLDRRSSARRLFLGLDQLSDAFTQFEERLLSRPLHVTEKRDDAARGEATLDPSLPVFVRAANAKAREIFALALHVRSQPTRAVIREYLTLRRDEDLRFDAMLPASKRTVLLADQSVSLDCVNIRDAALQKLLGELLKQSRVAGLEYAAFNRRDRAVLATKEGTREGLARTIDEGIRGVTEVYRTRRMLDDEFSDVRVDERSSLETEHQMSLALAGGAVRVLEAFMSSDARTQIEKRPEIVSREIAGALHWSARTVKILEILETKEYLAKERYEMGYLSSLNWRVTTRVMRHRALCAAFAVSTAFLLRAKALPTVLDLDVAYEQMITTTQITRGNVASVLQGVLFHSFLTGGMLPFPPRIAPALQDFDFLTADIDHRRTRRHSVHLDGRNRMVATLRIFDEDWNYGVVGKVTPGTKIADLLDQRSHGEFSRWRSYIEILGLIQSGAEDTDITCQNCNWAGPTSKVRGAHCPICDSTMIVARETERG